MQRRDQMKVRKVKLVAIWKKTKEPIKKKVKGTGRTNEFQDGVLKK